MTPTPPTLLTRPGLTTSGTIRRLRARRHRGAGIRAQLRDGLVGIIFVVVGAVAALDALVALGKGVGVAEAGVVVAAAGGLDVGPAGGDAGGEGGEG